MSNNENIIKNIEKVAYRGYSFTNDQKNAIVEFKKWYKDNNKLSFVLKGAAGTGKTYLVKYLIDNIIKCNFCVTAPTHKAVRVIERMTGAKGKTVQSLHGLRPNFNLESFNIDSLKYQSLGNIYIRNYKLVIMDECSMINRELKYLNEKRSKEFKTKILYIGDPYQLPPVNKDYPEELSEVFNYEDGYELKEIVRQKEGNPLIKLLSLLRKDIDENTSTFMKYLLDKRVDVDDNGHGYETLNTTDFTNKVKEVFSSKDFEENVEHCRYTAYTNKSISVWNKYIRNEIIENSEDIISKDDLLTGYITLVDEYNELSIINSEDYIIGDINKRVTEDGFDSYLVELIRVYKSKTGKLIKTKVNIVDYKSKTFKRYYDKLNLLHFNAVYSTAADRGKNWSQYYFPFKNKHLMLVSFPLREPSSEIRAWVNKDIDYGYGLTVHKLQGSTIKNIFVNLIDLCYIGGDTRKPRKNVSIRNKLIYTAISRASEKAIILL